MTTDLSVYTNKDNFEEVARLTGANVRDNVYLPRLTVTRDSEDEDGNSVPIGTFSVTQDDTTVYAKAATFRVFLNAYQYQAYDPVVRKYTNRSIIIKSFNEEALDEKGGLACGKIARKQLEAASDEVKARQRNIKCNRLVFGLVSFPDAVTAKGEKTSIESIPVTWKLSGTNFMAPKNAFDAITKMKHHFFQHNLLLSTKRQKNGATVYYEVLVDPVLNNEIEFTSEDIDTIKLFNETIDRENRYVVSKWKAVKNEAVTQQDVDIASALRLDDEIPF